MSGTQSGRGAGGLPGACGPGVRCDGKILRPEQFELGVAVECPEHEDGENSGGQATDKDCKKARKESRKTSWLADAAGDRHRLQIILEGR